MSMTTVWSFLLVLSVLIFVHELGHFFMARFFGIRVLKFSIGFGPRLWGIVKNGTDYCISAFPLGGFVKMLGEDKEEKVNPDDIPHSFSHKPLWQRAMVVFSGPFYNLLFAWVIFFVIYMAYGNPIILPVIGNVQPGSPAEMAGIKSGDHIISVYNKPIYSWNEVSNTIKSAKGKSVTIKVKREAKELQMTVTPEIKKLKNIFGEEVETPIIGITAAGNLKIERLDPFTAFGSAFVRTYELIFLTIKGIIKLIQRVVPLSSLGGPIMIAQMAGQQAELGILNLFFFMALLSINLGVLNLLPIPVLDGGHLVIFGIEAVLRRPLTVRQQEILTKAGMIFLGALMLFVFYNDIMRLIGHLPFGFK